MPATNFGNEVNEMTGNGNYENRAKLAWKICKITPGELIFGGFKQFGTTVQQNKSNKIFAQAVARLSIVAKNVGWLTVAATKDVILACSARNCAASAPTKVSKMRPFLKIFVQISPFLVDLIFCGKTHRQIDSCEHENERCLHLHVQQEIVQPLHLSKYLRRWVKTIDGWVLINSDETCVFMRLLWNILMIDKIEGNSWVINRKGRYV